MKKQIISTVLLLSLSGCSIVHDLTKPKGTLNTTFMSVFGTSEEVARTSSSTNSHQNKSEKMTFKPIEPVKISDPSCMARGEDGKCIVW